VVKNAGTHPASLGQVHDVETAVTFSANVKLTFALLSASLRRLLRLADDDEWRPIFRVGQLGMVGIIDNGEHRLSQRLGVVVAALVPVELSQIVHCCCDGGMLGTERLLLDRQRALVERLGFSVAALIVVEPSQVVQRCRNQRMIGTKRFFVNSQRPLVERLGVGVAALGSQSGQS
jgi:hypothetical protein